MATYEWECPLCGEIMQREDYWKLVEERQQHMIEKHMMKRWLGYIRRID